MGVVGFLRIPVGGRRVDPLGADTGSPVGAPIDPARVLQTLAPAEGVAVFLGVHNQLIAAVTPSQSVLISALVGLIASIVVTWIGATDPKSKRPFQWSVFWLRLVAYGLFVLLLCRSCGVEFFPLQTIFGPIALILFAAIAPALLNRLEGKAPAVAST